MGIASKTLKRNGMYDEAKEMCSRITSLGSYYEALLSMMNRQKMRIWKWR